MVNGKKLEAPFEKLVQVSYHHKSIVYKYESSFDMPVPLNDQKYTSEERMMIFLCRKESCLCWVTRFRHVQDFWFPVVLPTTFGPEQTFIPDPKNHS